MNRRKFIWASLGLGGLALAGGLRAAATRKHERHTLDGRAFGATVSLVVLDADRARAKAALDEAMAEVMAVDALMSLYRDDSQLVALNASGRLARPDPRVLEVLRHAQTVSAQTGGAFDVTVQPLWTAFAKAQARGGLPSAEEIAQARALVGWRDLLDPDIIYRMPVCVTRKRNSGESYETETMHFDEDFVSISFRVKRFLETQAWAADPPTRARRFVTGVRAWEAPGRETYDVTSSLLLVRSADDDFRTDLITAQRSDQVRFQADMGPKLLARKILADQTTIGTHNLAVFL